MQVTCEGGPAAGRVCDVADGCRTLVMPVASEYREVRYIAPDEPAFQCDEWGRWFIIGEAAPQFTQARYRIDHATNKAIYEGA